MAAALTFSVVICAYTEKRWDSLAKVIASVGQQSLPPAEIILVIDHNEALLARSRAAFQGVKVIENSGPQGLSGARNSGATLAQGDVTAFIDDDAWAEPDWLAQLKAGYKDPQVLGVGGLISPVWLDRQPKWFPGEFNWVVGCTYRGMPETDEPVRNLIGCNMSFRREVFEKMGGFRIGRVGTLSIGLENDETEFCIRLRHGWPQAELLYRPGAVVHHEVNGGRCSRNYFLKRCFSEGLSKARLSKLVGLDSGTSTERTYTFKTLPAGILRAIARSIAAFDFKGLEQASAILVGLTATVSGYLAGILMRLFPKTLNKSRELP